MSCANIEHNLTSNHTTEFSHGWASGIYAAIPGADGKYLSLYRDLQIDCPPDIPTISDVQEYEGKLKPAAGAVESSFNRGWICGAARAGVPLKGIAAKTGISERDIQQIVIQEWGMIWRCRASVAEVSRDLTETDPQYHDFGFDLSCSDFSEHEILSQVNGFLESWSQGSLDDLTVIDCRLENQTILRDIHCAIANGLDIGMLCTIARIKWVKKRCRECKGRWALGNSTWMVRCISRRCETSSDVYKCNCHEDGEFGTANSEITGYSGWSGLYQPTVTDAIIQDAASVPPRRLWDVVTNRVVLLAGKVSALCQLCYDMVSLSC